ncbi:11875_t:CDS:2, partial [Racocetra fulgida]
GVDSYVDRQELTDIAVYNDQNREKFDREKKKEDEMRNEENEKVKKYAR